MCGPADPTRRSATRQSDGPNKSQSQASSTPHDIAKNSESGQERSALVELQIFVLARRLAISAPLAEALAPHVWGLPR
jgi:hypothetical protein